jgi:repressor LexA
MAKGLTEKQRNILEHIIDFQKENGFPPTIREIGDTFGIGSLRGVTVHLDALVRKGFITRGRTSRSIRITAPDPRDPHNALGRESAVRLPLVTDLPPDTLSPTEAQIERYVSVPDELASPATAEGFVIRVGAAGVAGELIVPGDLVVIRPQETSTVNDLVAVRLNGGLGIRRATVEGAEVVVGRVVGLIRRY